MTEHVLLAPTQQRFRRPPILVLLAIVVLAAVAFCAVAGGWLAPQDPNFQNLTLGAVGPSGEHLLGTDDLGRDVFSRVLVGTRPALIGPIVVALATTVIASAIGVTAALRGGVFDFVVCRFIELVYSLPALLMAIVVVGVLEGGYVVALLVMTFFSIPAAARLIRSAALAQAGMPYLDAARTLGVSESRLVFRHLLPNVLSTIVTTAMLDFVSVLVGLASLSFLGLGVAPGQADWGRMIAENRTLLDLNPWAAVVPVVAVILTSFAVTVLGDAGYDRVSQSGGNRG